MVKVKMQRLKDNELVLSDEYDLEYDEVKKMVNDKSESFDLLQVKKEYMRIGKYLLPIKFNKKYTDGTKVKYKFEYEPKKEAENE